MQDGRRGAAGQQYAIVVGLIAVIAIAAISFSGTTVKALFFRTSNSLNGVGNLTESGGGTATPPTGPTVCTDTAVFAATTPAKVSAFDGNWPPRTLLLGATWTIWSGSPLFAYQLTTRCDWSAPTDSTMRVGDAQAVESAAPAPVARPPMTTHAPTVAANPATTRR